jgi:hypothetical protein
VNHWRAGLPAQLQDASNRQANDDESGDEHPHRGQSTFAGRTGVSSFGTQISRRNSGSLLHLASQRPHNGNYKHGRCTAEAVIPFRGRPERPTVPHVEHWLPPSAVGLPPASPVTVALCPLTPKAKIVPRSAISAINVVRPRMPVAVPTAGRARRAVAHLFGPRRVHPRTVAALPCRPG